MSPDFRELLAEGLDLCVRARTLDKALLQSDMRAIIPESAKAYPETWGKSGTPHLWTIDQYDTDLADWERRAREALRSDATGERE